jgi:hypothetical protein
MSKKYLEKWLRVILGLLIMVTSIITVQIPVAQAAGNPITMAAFGQKIRMPGMDNQSNLYGDTWDTTWRSNDDTYIQCNDYSGYRKIQEYHLPVYHALCAMIESDIFQ